MSTATHDWLVHPAIFIFVGIVLYCIYIPIAIYYYFFRFRKHLDVIFIQKRYPKITMFIVCSVISCFTLNFSVIAFYRCMGQRTVRNRRIYDFLWNVTIFTSPLTLLAFIYGLVLRSWMVYFDIHLTQRVLNCEWKSIIDPSLEHTNDWYLKHKQTWGSKKFVFRFILFSYIIGSCISIIVWFVEQIIGYFTAMLMDFTIFLGIL